MSIYHLGFQQLLVFSSSHGEPPPVPSKCLCLHRRHSSSGISEADHMQKLEQVLSHLSSAGITFKRSKCTFATTSVEYLGHIIDSIGLHPSPAKVQAIQKAPAPTNITELRAFLGLVNYYYKFLPNLSSTLSPLHRLLRKCTKWNCTQNQQIAFDKVKELLQSDTLLVHFDGTKQILV